jgi:predicted HNH restriction endonuclease
VSSYIRKCRECGLEAHTEDELYLFANDKELPYGRKNFCRVCHSKDATNRDRKRRVSNREKMLEYLGGEYKCKDCGITNSYYGMFDWHHLEPSRKSERPSRLLTRKWETLKKELDKCIFLCSNCHRLRHKACPVI